MKKLLGWALALLGLGVAARETAAPGSTAATVGLIDAAEQDVLARTAWGEARGEGWDGMAAVAAVVMNRVAIGGWWGSTVTQVCLHPFQFSAWNANDPNRPALLAVTDRDPAFADALQIAQLALTGLLIDRTGGATHYHAMSVDPSWTRGATYLADIGGHRFWRAA